MAGVSTASLAAAVSNAGGLGAIGIGNLTAAKARDLIRDTKSRLNSPDTAFHVNVFCHTPVKLDDKVEKDWIDYIDKQFKKFGKSAPGKLTQPYKSFLVDDEMLEMLISEKPPIVSFHFGLPSQDRIDRLKAAGIVLFSSATNVDEAKAAVSAGVDAIIAQGWEAGGHRGVFDPQAPDEKLSTLDLVKVLLDSGLTVPIIAAGAISNGTDIHKVLNAGAIAAQMGTAFIACDESAADKAYRERLADPSSTTVMVSGVSGREARCLVNSITAVVEDGVPGRPTVPPYPWTYDASKQLNEVARAAGDSAYGAQWSGTGSRNIRPQSAESLVRQLVAELGND
jgi:nitronate monooxygenase